MGFVAASLGKTAGLSGGAAIAAGLGRVTAGGSGKAGTAAAGPACRVAGGGVAGCDARIGAGSPLPRDGGFGVFGGAGAGLTAPRSAVASTAGDTVAAEWCCSTMLKATLPATPTATA